MPHALALRMVAGALLATALIAPAIAADDPNRVVAVVNGHEIKMADVDAAREMLPPQAMGYPPDVIFDFLVNNLVNTRLMAEEARRQGLAKDAEVRRRLAQVEDKVLEQEYLIRRVDKELTDKRLRDSYDQLIKDTPPEEEVRARHILVASEQAANDVVARLNKGEDFAAIAKSVSTDGSAQSGGDLGYFTRERMVKPFSDAAFAMRPGSYTTKPVRTQFGWHVIKLEDKRNKKAPTFEEAEDEVRASARRELAQSFVEELRGKATIENFGMEGRQGKGSAPAKKAAPKTKSEKK